MADKLFDSEHLPSLPSTEAPGNILPGAADYQIFTRSDSQGLDSVTGIRPFYVMRQMATGSGTKDDQVLSNLPEDQARIHEMNLSSPHEALVETLLQSRKDQLQGLQVVGKRTAQEVPSRSSTISFEQHESRLMEQFERGELGSGELSTRLPAESERNQEVAGPENTYIPEATRLPDALVPCYDPMDEKYEPTSTTSSNVAEGWPQDTSSSAKILVSAGELAQLHGRHSVSAPRRNCRYFRNTTYRTITPPSQTGCR